MKKKIKALLAFTITGILLAGCGQSNQPASSESATPAASPVQAESSAAPASPAAPAAPAEPVEISFWHHMEGINAEALEDTCKAFNETLGKEKGITVVPSFQGTNTGEKLNTLAQAGDWKNFPDTCQVTSAAIPTIYNYDLLFTPEEMYASGSDVILPIENIIPNNARTFTYKGELLAMPFSNSTILLYYNKDAFAEAGITAPPKTIAEMADIASKLVTKSGNDIDRYGVEVQVKRYQLSNWVGGEGDFNFLGDNEGGRADMMTKFTFGQDGSLMRYLDEWEKVIATGAYKPIEDNINEEFAMQSTAMAIMSSARISKVTELVNNNFQWGTAPLPKVSQGDKGGAAVGGSGVVMFDNGDAAKKQAAWIFTQYLGGVDAQNIFCQKSGYIPMNYTVYESDSWKNFAAQNDKVVAAVDQLMASNPNVQEPFDLVTGEVNSIIDEEMTKFGQGQQDKQTTHDNIVKRCNDKIAEYVAVNKK